MKNIIDYLVKDNEISIIALKQNNDDIEKYLEIPIRYVKSFPFYILNTRERKNKAIKKWQKVLLGIEEYVFRTGSLVTRVISPLALNMVTTAKLREKVEEALKCRTYDYVLCNAKPFEGFEAVMGFISSYPDTNFIGYQTDDFATAEDERFLPVFIVNRILHNRKKRLNEYANRFCNYGILESVYRKEAKMLKKGINVKSMGLPLLIDYRRRIPNNRYERETIRFVFAGSLVKSFRPAEDCLEIMLEVAGYNKIAVNIYQRGDCNEVVNMYEKKSRGTIRNKGSVSTEEAYDAMENADILISISNIAGDQISGKTFDYMATGKPIIHFYYNKNDLNAKIINRYKLGLNIQILENNRGESVKRIMDFVKSVDGEQMTIQEVRKEFCDYTVESVVNMLFAS